jgi:hypothetical protein
MLRTPAGPLIGNGMSKSPAAFWAAESHPPKGRAAKLRTHRALIKNAAISINADAWALASESASQSELRSEPELELVFRAAWE